MTFSPLQLSELKAPLSRDVVKTREQGSRAVSYVEGWHVIAEANRIFGFDGWSSATVDVVCAAERERKIGRDNPRDGWGVTYTARVRITVICGETTIIRDGFGAGHGIDLDVGQAHESAIKEAETDARKRALMTFGNPFGLALYDKAQSNVADESDISRQRYIDECKIRIAGLAATPVELATWWKSDTQKQARRDFELNKDEVAMLKALVMSHLPQQETTE